MRARRSWVYRTPSSRPGYNKSAPAPPGAEQYSHMGMFAALPNGRLAAAWQVRAGRRSITIRDHNFTSIEFRR